MRAFANATALPNIHDKFMDKTPAMYWQYDFHYAQPFVKQLNGNLSLTGRMLNGNTMGIIYGLRPVSDNFTITTTVANHNNALKGLAFYGSVKSALGIGIRGNQVISWMVKEGVFMVTDSATVIGSKSIQFKIRMSPDKTCGVYYRYGEARGLKCLQAGLSWPAFYPSGTGLPVLDYFLKGYLMSMDHLKVLIWKTSRDE